jgi:hypothetical protein
VNLTLSRLLAARAHTEPGQTALVVHGRATLTFGDWTRRADAAPLSGRSTPADLDGFLRDCRAAGLLYGPKSLRGARPYEGGWPLAEITASPADLPDVRPGDPAQILYASGEGTVATRADLAHGLGGRRRPFAHSRHLAHAFPIGTDAGVHDRHDLSSVLLLGTPAAPGEIGEVWTRAPAGGWLRMGYLFLVDRDSDVVEAALGQVGTVGRAD